MAKKSSSSSSVSSRPSGSATDASGTKPAAAAVSSTPVRNTPIPRPQSSPQTSFQKKQPTQEQIARRAYEIWQSGKGGSQQENWYRAERELRGI